MEAVRRGARARPTLGLGCLLCACANPPRDPISLIVPDVPIEAAADPAVHDGPLTEPFVAINPHDANNAVIGVIATSVDRDGPWHCAAITTVDDGRSWVRRDFAGMQRCIDPWVAFMGADTVLLTALEIRRDSVDEGRFRLVSYRSGDRGLTWAGPDTLGRGFEHPMLLDDGGRALVLARSMSRGPAGPLRHRVYLGASVDGGRTLREIASSRHPVTGPDTTEITPTGFARLSDGRLVAAATGGGRAWALASAAREGTFEAAGTISESCAGAGGETEFAGWPFLAADGRSDRLYHACVRARYEGVEVRFSEDGGASWSDPRLLGASGPGSTGPREPHTRTAMLAVDPDGAVAVGWYDRGADPGRACQHVMAAVSTDEGVTFSDPLQLSTAPSCPRTPGNGWVAESWTAGGDYSSLAASPDGGFRIVWADSRSGRFELRTAAFLVNRVR